MINRILIAVALLTLNANFALAQNSTPEFKNKVHAFTASQRISDLDNTDLQTELNTNMGGTSVVNIKALGKTSGFQSMASDTYIVRIEPGTDPELAVELFQFSIDKKVRKIKVIESRMGKNRDIELPKQKLKFTKVADGVYTITTVQPLEAGEYAFIVNRPNIELMGAMNPTRIQGFAFTVL